MEGLERARVDALEAARVDERDVGRKAWLELDPEDPLEPPQIVSARPAPDREPTETLAGAEVEKARPGEAGPGRRAPKVVLTGVGELWASETMVVTPDGGRALGVSWRPWSVS